MDRLSEAKRSVHAGLVRLAAAAPDALASEAAALLHGDYAAHVAHPVNDLSGPEEAVARWWRPLATSFRHLQRTHGMVAAGQFNGSTMVGVLGHYRGTFAADFLGIPATHKPAWLRFGELHRVEDGRIAESWMLPDLLDLMRQAGVWPLAPSLGAEAAWPAPGGPVASFDAVDREGGQASLDLVLAMHAGLGSFDGKTLGSMDHARHWAPGFAWYGPAGIGTAFGLDGFETVHQIPFLIAFPDRKGGQHVARMGDGPCVVTGGWPSVTATHTGDGFLGLPASGRKVGMRVMDFYRCDNGLIAENWVPIDVIHLLLQMGYDVFARLAHLRGNPRTSL